MPNDLSVTRPAGASPASQPAHPAAPGPPPPAHTASSRALPNPTLRLDPELGMVVIEFRDTHGAVKDSIPTQHQLDAYRVSERTHAPPVPTAKDPKV